MPRVLPLVLPSVVCVLLACMMLFMGGLDATPAAQADVLPAAVTAPATASEDAAQAAYESQASHDAIPTSPESEPAASEGRATASRCAIEGRYLTASRDDGPRTRSPAYRGCGPPR